MRKIENPFHDFGVCFGTRVSRAYARGQLWPPFRARSFRQCAVPGAEIAARVILATGYRGPFDLEIIGPRLLAEGREAGLKRAIANVQQAIRNGIDAMQLP